MTLAEILDMSPAYVRDFQRAQRVAEHDGSNGDVYAGTSDTYFPSLYFMSATEVNDHILWWDDQNGDDNHEGVWDAVVLVDTSQG